MLLEYRLSEMVSIIEFSESPIIKELMGYILILKGIVEECHLGFFKVESVSNRKILLQYVSEKDLNGLSRYKIL